MHRVGGKCVLSKSMLRTAVLLSIVLVAGVSASAQTPLSDLLSQVKRAVVVVNAYDDRGNTLRQGAGFFIAKDRVVTNFKVVEDAAKISIKTFNDQLASVKTTRADRLGNIAVLQISEQRSDVACLPIASVNTITSEVIVSDGSNGWWKVGTDQVGSTLTLEHLDGRLQITASLSTKSGEARMSLKAHAIGPAMTHDAGPSN
jgi:hypothetical protein